MTFFNRSWLNSSSFESLIRRKITNNLLSSSFEYSESWRRCVVDSAVGCRRFSKTLFILSQTLLSSRLNWRSQMFFNSHWYYTQVLHFSSDNQHASIRASYLIITFRMSFEPFLKNVNYNNCKAFCCASTKKISPMKWVCDNSWLINFFSPSYHNPRVGKNFFTLRRLSYVITPLFENILTRASFV